MDPHNRSLPTRVLWRQDAFTPCDQQSEIDHATADVAAAITELLSETPRMSRARVPKAIGPTRGWTSEPPRQRMAWMNPRTPAVPASLDLNHEEYYAGAALVGIVSAQTAEPAPEWVSELAFKIGQRMAAEAQRRRKKG